MVLLFGVASRTRFNTPTLSLSHSHGAHTPILPLHYISGFRSSAASYNMTARQFDVTMSVLTAL